MKLSIVIPAYNEEQNIAACLDELREVIGKRHRLSYEIIVVDDNSDDGTADVVRERMAGDNNIRLVSRQAPSGFGRAVRAGVDQVEGDAVVIYMADLSDDPEDVVAYYRKLDEGYDCVFGSRFIKGSVVEKYPALKLVVNRIVNRLVQSMFFAPFNDLTNAFKAYRTAVIRECGPYRSSHFNITLEMALGALIRKYEIAQVPISWHGRTWGSSNLRLREMGRRYLCTLLMLFFQRVLLRDDLMAEKLAGKVAHRNRSSAMESRLAKLESDIASLLKAESADDTSDDTSDESEQPAESSQPIMQSRST